MVRGTTPTHTFTVNTDLTDATVLYITYQQGGTTVLEKTLNDVTIDGTTITVELTQAETLLFSDSAKVQVQLRVGFSDGSRLASDVMQLSIGGILKDGQI